MWQTIHASWGGREGLLRDQVPGIILARQKCSRIVVFITSIIAVLDNLVTMPSLSLPVRWLYLLPLQYPGLLTAWETWEACKLYSWHLESHFDLFTAKSPGFIVFYFFKSTQSLLISLPIIFSSEFPCCVSFLRAMVTNDHKLDGYKQHIHSHCYRGQKSAVKVPAGPCSFGNPEPRQESWGPLAYECIMLISASVCTWPSPFVFVCVHVSLF